MFLAGQVQDVYSPWVIPTLVFLVLVVFGSFFLLKLLLAVIWDKFASVQAQIDISKEAEALRDNLTLVRRGCVCGWRVAVPPVSCVPSLQASIAPRSV